MEPSVWRSGKRRGKKKKTEGKKKIKRGERLYSLIHVTNKDLSSETQGAVSSPA